MHEIPAMGKPSVSYDAKGYYLGQPVHAVVALTGAEVANAEWVIVNAVVDAEAQPKKGARARETG